MSKTLSRLVWRAFVIILAGIAPVNADAAPILWTIDAGGPISGSFVYDADVPPGTYSDIAITSTTGASWDTTHLLTGVWSDSDRLLLSHGVQNGSMLLVAFDPGLSNAGGAVSGSFFELICLNPSGCVTSDAGFGVRTVLEATIEIRSPGPTVVPEPAMMLLLTGGLLGAARSRWRQC